MKENESIESLLNRIKQVDAPAFLFTRIETKINASKKNVIPVRKIAFGLACAMALVLGNVLLIAKSNTSLSNTESTVFDEMNLTNSNQLYNE